MELTDRKHLFLALVVFIIAYGLVGTGDFEDALQSQRHYCDSVSRYAESRGEVGHPPYNLQIKCDEQ
jgi:hypothetical protein